MWLPTTIFPTWAYILTGTPAYLGSRLRSAGIPVTNSGGWALPGALVTALVATIAVLVSLDYQFRSSRPALAQPAAAQALLTARSGIWYGYEALAQASRPDLSRGRMRAELGNGLFQEAPASQDGYSILTAVKTMVMDPFRSGNSGPCTVKVVTDDVYLSILSSAGSSSIVRREAARFGACPFRAAKDTVVFLTGMPAPERFEAMMITGSVSSPGPDSVSAAQYAGRFLIHQELVDSFSASVISGLVQQVDSAVRRTPLLVSSSLECRAIAETVFTDLFIDGSKAPVTWSPRTPIHVQGDLQVTGDVTIRNARLMVGGDAKLWGNTTMSSAYLVAGKRIFFGDEAVSCHAVFQGIAMASGAVEICRNTRILFPSTVVRLRNENDGRQPGVRRTSPTRAAPTSQPVYHAIYIRSESRLNGCFISLSSSLGIRTYPRSETEGVIWSRAGVLHGGQLSGVMVTGTLVGDTTQPGSTSGRISRLQGIDNYFLPFFMGNLSVMEWNGI